MYCTFCGKKTNDSSMVCSVCKTLHNVEGDNGLKPIHSKTGKIYTHKTKPIFSDNNDSVVNKNKNNSFFVESFEQDNSLNQVNIFNSFFSNFIFNKERCSGLSNCIISLLFSVVSFILFCSLYNIINLWIYLVITLVLSISIFFNVKSFIFVNQSIKNLENTPTVTLIFSIGCVITILINIVLLVLFLINNFYIFL